MEPTTAPSVFRIDVERGKHIRHIYIDYEPAAGTQFRHLVSYRKIRAWIMQEYGLTVTDNHIAKIKRQHGLSMERSRLDATKPVNVPPEKEAAIVAALRYFGLL